MARWANEETAVAEERLLMAARLDDKAFVEFIKVSETTRPELRMLNCWMDGVRRELDMRLLLKVGG